MAEECKSIELYPPSTNLATNENNETLTVLSYNTLYKDWCTNEMYPFASEKHRSWPHRRELIANTIKSYNADIVCLQELHLESYYFNEDFAELCSELSYEYVLTPVDKKVAAKQRFKGQGKWGVGTLYNSKRFKCVYQECRSRTMLCLFTDLIGIKNCKKCCQHFENDENEMICIYHSFFVANVHLSGDPVKHEKRLREIRNIISKLTHFACVKISKDVKLKTNINKKLKNMRIIICGDFNSGKTCLIDKYLIDGKYEKDKHKFQFDDAYHNALKSLFEKNEKKSKKKIDAFFDRLEWFPTFGNGVNISALDFMYFTRNNMELKGVCKTLHFEDEMLKKIQSDVQKIRKNPKKEDIEENINVKSKDCLCLPNGKYGSDHLPIAAKFVLFNICPKDEEKCNCCWTGSDTAVKKQKKKKKKKKKTKERDIRDKQNWIVHPMTSF